MIILSNCLMECADEGFIKVANNLTQRIKLAFPETTVVSFAGPTPKADIHIQLGKLFLGKPFMELLRKKHQRVFFIPYASNSMGSILRVFLLSIANRGDVTVLFALRHPMNGLSRFLLKLSGAKIVVLSRESYEYFSLISGDRVQYLKTGVDTQQFQPVSETEKMELRRKYGLPLDKTVVLHVGHLKRSRNVEQFAKLDETCHGVLVLSSRTADMKDIELQEELRQLPNLTIIEEYIPQIQELYQLSDVYFFPVCEDGACLDLPLSALEAAACGKPVVCTSYGELREFSGKEGFWHLESFEGKYLNDLLKQAASEGKVAARTAVVEYDWDFSVDKFVFER